MSVENEKEKEAEASASASASTSASASAPMDSSPEMQEELDWTAPGRIKNHQTDCVGEIDAP